ncbi:hypothetical protein N7G274_001790 [Stereocaulon virgatum]|uniref:Uncharacterized protein n=1 Tax=Stereocaulon virgatum TaxID=373712 RepID=A0ABR4AS93_9LECA
MPPKRRLNPKTPTTTTTTLTPNNISPRIPPPFHPAPQTLLPFLTTLSPSHIYITSHDTSPIPQKRRIYLIPLLLTLTLTLLLAYRLLHALPTYTSIFLAALGYETRMSLQVKGADAYTKLGIGGEGALRFLGSFCS